jgi:catechol 2,3-dioxygenase-like lactoylglutathione lyase family enzyme
MTSKYRVDPRIRALGKARIDVTRRATNEQEWQKMWREPRYPFPFDWGQSWKLSIQYIVDDYAAEIGFFIDVLGLPVYAFSPSYAMFTSPDQSFAFSVIAAQEGSASTDPDTLRIQFMVNNILKVSEELERRGIVFEQKPQPDPTPGSCLYVGYFRTPHGVCVDLFGEVEVDPYGNENRPGTEEEGIDELSVMDFLSELGKTPQTDPKPQPPWKEEPAAEAPSELEEPLHFDEDLWTLNSSHTGEESGSEKADLGEVGKSQNGSCPSNGSNSLPLKRVEESKRSGSGSGGEPFRRSAADLPRRNGSSQKPTNGRRSGIFPKPGDLPVIHGGTPLPLRPNGAQKSTPDAKSNPLNPQDSREKSEEDRVQGNLFETKGGEDGVVEDDVVEDDKAEDSIAKNAQRAAPEQMEDEELKYEDLDDDLDDSDLLDDSGDPY